MLRRNRISILTGLKVSSLACKRAFYIPEHNAKRYLKELSFEGLEMQRWNVPTDRNQQANTKSGVICLVIMFNPEAMVIIMSKLVNSLYFLLITAKTSDSLSKIFKCIKKISFSSFRKCYELFVLSYH